MNKAKHTQTKSYYSQYKLTYIFYGNIERKRKKNYLKSPLQVTPHTALPNLDKNIITIKTGKLLRYNTQERGGQYLVEH